MSGQTLSERFKEYGRRILPKRLIYPADRPGQPHKSLRYAQGLRVRAEISQMFRELEPDPNIPLLPIIPLGEVLSICGRGFRGLDGVTTMLGMDSLPITNYLKISAIA